ncbi:hypothetical protein DRP04_10650 [Archaeoglobales archaeon]|nr:MAG: hypothetical protein DRP04_10650 [Archaeoglobales archaeon]
MYDLTDRQRGLIAMGIKEKLVKVEDGRIYYLIQKKSYDFTDPEEHVRAVTYIELVMKYKYPPHRIDFEITPPRREPKLPADIVVYKDDYKEKPFIVVECKATSSKADWEVAKREGLGNANLLLSEWLLVVCGEEEAVYYVKDRPSLAKLEEFRRAELPIAYGNVPRYKYKKGGEVFEELRKTTLNELDNKFSRCHDIIWEGGKRDPAEAFDEMSKLMFAKIYDEKFTKVGEYYRFQVGTNEDAFTVAKRIKELYKEVQEKEPEVFKEDIKVSNEIIYEVVKVLQDVSLTKTDLDAKGRAFERFLGKVFRGEFGQFFTPREIVDFMVKFIDPDYTELVIDPACGSSGFLLYSIKHIMEKASKEYNEDTSKEIVWEFSHRNVFGIEINDRIARIAMMDMVIHEDGHTNIECNDALEDYENFDPRKDIKPNKYHVLLTNPPFGARIKASVKPYFKKYELAKNEKGKIKNSEMSEILFIERCLDLIKPGGRMGIILPDSAFTNKRYIGVVNFILSKARVLAVISLPQHAFIPFGSMAKTSILFLKKLKDDEKVGDYPIFMAHVEKIGYDATGRPDRNDLPKVLEEWEKFKQDPAKYPLNKEISPELWFAKVMFSQLGNKLDVEAYGREYMEILERIMELEAKGFTVLTLEDVTKAIFPGISPSKDDYVTDERNGIPIIKTGSVIKVRDRIGIIDWQKLSYVSRDKYGKSKKFLQKYDILVQSVAHSKDYIGDKVAIVDNALVDTRPTLALSKFLIVRPNPKKVNPYYLFLYLSSEYGQRQFKHYIRGMTAEIYEFDLKNLLVIVPPKDEQDRIAENFLKTLAEIFKLKDELRLCKEKLTHEFNKILS